MTFGKDVPLGFRDTGVRMRLSYIGPMAVCDDP